MIDNTIVYNKKEFNKLPVSDKLEILLSDGLWYSLPKLKKFSKIPVEDILQWVEKEKTSGRLIQDPLGSHSYRYPTEVVKQWHDKNGYNYDQQIVNFNFPAKIWDDITEVEGFINAPLRQIGTVTFHCDDDVAKIIKEQLLGLARVRAVDYNTYKAYCLDIKEPKKIIEKVFSQYPKTKVGRIYGRSNSYRREMVDFSVVFRNSIIEFYRDFSKLLMKGTMETINIFLPDPQDKESQILFWIITAIEKFDEKNIVPFSGYLNSVLSRWPYDLPTQALGRELSDFQRKKSRALKQLEQSMGVDRIFSSKDIAHTMDIPLEKYEKLSMEDKNWKNYKKSTTITWEDTGEEKKVSNIFGDIHDIEEDTIKVVKNIDLANRISHACILAAIESDKYDDGLTLIGEIDTDAIDIEKINNLDKSFVQNFGQILGL